MPTQSDFISRLGARRFALIVLVSLPTLVGLIIWARVAIEYQHAMSGMSERLSDASLAAAAEIEDQLQRLRGDAMFITSMPSVAGLISASGHDGTDPVEGSSALQWQHRLEAVCMAYAKTQPRLLGIRLVGVADGGRELVRVDRGPEGVVAASAGQRVARPDLLTPDLLRPDLLRPDLLTPDLLTPDLLTPDLLKLDVAGAGLTMGQRAAPMIRILGPGGASGTDQPVLRATVPVRAPGGALFGMVVIDMVARELLQAVRPEVGTTFDAYLVGDDGRWLADQPSRDVRSGPEAAAQWMQRAGSLRAGGAAESGGFTVAGVALHASMRPIMLNAAGDDRLLLAVAGPDAIVTQQTELVGRTMLIASAALALLLAVFFAIYRRQVLRASEQQMLLARIVESANEAIIGKTLDGVVTSWNRAAERMFGYSYETAIGRPLQSLIVPQGYEHEVATILARIRHGDVVDHFRTVRQRSDGRQIHVAITVSPVLANDGRVVGASKTARDISREVEAERLLAETRARSEATTRASGVGLWDWDLITDELVCDDTMLALFGLDRADATDLDIYEIWQTCLHPQDRLAADTALKAARDQEASLDTIFRIVPYSGETRHVRAKASLSRDERGEALRMLGTMFDVTEQVERQARIEVLAAGLEAEVMARTAELRAQGAVQTAILDAAGYAIIATDKGGLITLFNPAAEKLLHYAADEMLGRETLACFHDPDEVVARSLVLSAELGHAIEPGLEVFVAKARSGAVDTNNWTYCRSDGKRVPVLLTVTALRDEDHEISGFLGIAVDLTEQLRQEQRVRDSERLLGAIANNIPVMVGYWDRNLRCRFGNDAYRNWYGRTQEQLIGADMRDVLGEDTFTLSERYIKAALQGIPQRFEQTLKRADDAQAQIWAHYVPDMRGYAVHGFYVLVTDITDLKDTQSRLEVLNAGFQAKAAAAEAATVAKSQFLANMSHEIRSPMNGMLGMLQLLMGSGLSARQSDYANKAYAATQTLLHLLNDILDFSKIEANKLTIERFDFGLEATLREVAGIQAASLGDKPIEMVLWIDPTLPTRVVGDAFRLRQVLTNLVGNAIKFTERGEIVISASRVADADRPDLIEFAVSDTGIGMDEAVRSCLFEVFIQGEASTTRRYGGTGLGLAICQRIVGLMGGEITLASEPGRGSDFHFSIPLPPADDQGVSTVEALAPVLRADRSMFVLVVDDHAMTRDVMVSLVTTLGWRCECASDGLEALAKIETRCHGDRYDAVLLDWEMPVLDGWHTARRVREMLDPGEMPIIIMVTARGRQDLAARSAEERALIDGFVVKPISVSTLFDALIETAAPAIQAKARGGAGTGSLRLQGLRLLVVDDNALNLQVAQELLSREGAIVDLASGGNEAVAMTAAASPPYDLIMMDIQMPDMDGYDATKMLRRRHETQSVPVIAMTANAMTSDKEACLAAGMNDHVAKPIDLDVLVEAILRQSRGVHPAIGRVAGPMDLRVIASGVEREAPASLSDAGEVDVAAALRRLGNHNNLYARLVQRFSEDAPGMLDELTAAVAAGARDRVLAGLHTFKGLSAAVGLNGVADSAAQLGMEMKAHGGLDAVAAEIEALRSLTMQGTSALLSELTILALDVPASSMAEGLADRAAVERLLEELDGLLATSNMRAITVCAALRGQIGTALVPLMDTLSGHVDKLHFERARDDARRLRALLP